MLPVLWYNKVCGLSAQKNVKTRRSKIEQGNYRAMGGARKINAEQHDSV